MMCLNILYLALFTIGSNVCSTSDIPLDNIQLDIDDSTVVVYCKTPSSKYVNVHQRIRVERAIDPKTLCNTVATKEYK